MYVSDAHYYNESEQLVSVLTLNIDVYIKLLGKNICLIQNASTHKP